MSAYSLMRHLHHNRGMFQTTESILPTFCGQASLLPFSPYLCPSCASCARQIKTFVTGRAGQSPINPQMSETVVSAENLTVGWLASVLNYDNIESFTVQMYKS